MWSIAGVFKDYFWVVNICYQWRGIKFRSGLGVYNNSQRVFYFLKINTTTVRDQLTRNFINTGCGIGMGFYRVIEIRTAKSPLNSRWGRGGAEVCNVHSKWYASHGVV